MSWLGKQLKINLAIPGRYCCGLGDCITWAWIANGPTPLEFYAQGRNREILEVMGARLSDNADGAIDPNEAYNVEKRERCARPRVEIWCEYLGIQCEPKRPQMTTEHHGFMPRRVFLCPHTHYKAREWPPAYWMDLNWELRRSNIEVCWLMEHDDQQYSARGISQRWFGYSMKDVANLLGSPAVIVANDSMPAHMGGTIGRPTLAMMGPSSPNCLVHMSSVIPMQSESTSCVGCHFGGAYRAACDMSCQALMTLLPSDVAKTVIFLVDKINDSRRVSSAVSANATAEVSDRRRRE